MGMPQWIHMCQMGSHSCSAHKWGQMPTPQEVCQQELLPWVPIAQPPRESCLDLLVGQPHSLLTLLDAQTWLAQVRAGAGQTSTARPPGG